MLFMIYYKRKKEKLERQLHDIAVMIERLENSRQKLLAEQSWHPFTAGLTLEKQATFTFLKDK
jgi:hypothetical protein